MEQTPKDAVRQATSTIDEKRLIFLDVGLWGCLAETDHPLIVTASFVVGMPLLGMAYAIKEALREPGIPLTTFGVVCGHYVLLCDWLGRALGGFDFDLKERSGNRAQLRPPWTNFWQDIPQILREFFHYSRYLDGTPDEKPRGYVVQATYSPVELTPPDKPLIVLPDLHLNLYAGTAVDRFRYKPTDESDELIPLDKELRMLLDIAKEVGATTAQVGDMYEVWETEFLMRKQYHELYDFKYSSSFDHLSEHFPDIFDKYYDQLYEILEREDGGGKVAPDPQIDFDYENRYWDLRYDTPLRRLFETWDHEAVSFRHTDDILRAIRKKHSDLFEGENGLFDFKVRGNHDNRLRNSFWPSKTWFAEHAFGILRVDPVANKHVYKMLTYPTETSKDRNSVPDHLVFGRVIGEAGRLRAAEGSELTKEDRIWIEHGHIYDWHNNDNDCFKSSHGFDIVVQFLWNNILGKRGIGQEMFIGWAGRSTDFMEYEMRYPEFMRTDQIFRQIPNVRLVIMGHTHEPMIRTSNSFDFFSNYEKSQLSKHIVGEYEDSKYWREVFDVYTRHEDHMRDRYMVLEEPDG